MKNILTTITIIDNLPINANHTSTTVKIGLTDNIGIQIAPTNIGMASIDVQVSLDESVWTSLTLDPVPALDGSGDNVFIDINQIPASYLRVVLTAASGAELGNVTVKAAAKGV